VFGDLFGILLFVFIRRPACHFIRRFVRRSVYCILCPAYPTTFHSTFCASVLCSALRILRVRVSRIVFGVFSAFVRRLVRCLVFCVLRFGFSASYAARPLQLRIFVISLRTFPGIKTSGKIPKSRSSNSNEFFRTNIDHVKST